MILTRDPSPVFHYCSVCRSARYYHLQISSDRNAAVAVCTGRPCLLEGMLAVGALRGQPRPLTSRSAVPRNHVPALPWQTPRRGARCRRLLSLHFSFSPRPGFPAAAYGPVAAAAVAAARGSGRGARGRANPQSAGSGKSSVGILCGCSSPSFL